MHAEHSGQTPGGRAFKIQTVKTPTSVEFRQRAEACRRAAEHLKDEAMDYGYQETLKVAQWIERRRFWWEKKAEEAQLSNAQPQTGTATKKNARRAFARSQE
jgi:hypothetical protein